MDTVLLWDNARYHTSDSMRTTIQRLGLTVIQSGPYSFSAAPAEKLFSAMKLGHLNEEGEQTGKR